jgi:NAD(P)-dependent dehydrogenase (short-subunit alcohol dehydrogenase family)
MSAKVAIVFGGSRGIGGAIASRLALDGFDVALTYVSRPDRAGDLVSAIEDIGRRAIAIQATARIPPRSEQLSPTRSSISARLTRLCTYNSKGRLFVQDFDFCAETSC